jgi:uncharacterized Zn-binding protein involved in type VI secretion
MGVPTLPKAHRDGDRRACDGHTKVVEQSTVFVNGKLWAVKGSKEGDHLEGALINSGTTVVIGGTPVIVHKPDQAHPDGAGHIGNEDETAEGSDNVFAFGNGPS